MVWGNKESIAPLLDLIEDANVDIRKAVVQALGNLYEFAEGRTLDPLLQILLNDRDSEIRYNAAEGLHYLRDNRAADALIAGLKNPQSAIRKESARLLSALKDERAVDALIYALKDNDIEVREWAVEALWTLLPYNTELTIESEEKMREALPSALMDESIEVQERAKNILEWIA
jgi:HEAT repeat protein